MRVDVILADAGDLYASGLKVGARRGERLSLNRAARSVVLGVNVNDQPFACVIAKRDGFPILVWK